MEEVKEKVMTFIVLHSHEARLRRLEGADLETRVVSNEVSNEERFSQLEKQVTDLKEQAQREPECECEPHDGVVAELQRMKRQHADLVASLKRRRVLPDEPEEEMELDPVEEQRELARRFMG